eukprot:344517-Chlamydomonas_euryale.AAC.5
MTRGWQCTLRAGEPHTKGVRHSAAQDRTERVSGPHYIRPFSGGERGKWTVRLYSLGFATEVGCKLQC